MSNTLIEVLEDIMFENNLSIAELSRKLNIDHKQLSNYIKGKYFPSLKNALNIANHFNISLDFLAGLSNQKKYIKFSEPDYDFYTRYKHLLNAQKTSHYKLSKELNININNLRYWKLGVLPSFRNLIKISEYLDTSIDFLIGRNKII